MGDLLRYVQQTTDGGYIVGGSSSSPISGDKTQDSIGWDDYWIVKTDSLGNIMWQNTIGGTHWDKLETIHQTTDGGYILGGISLSNISGDKTENCIGGWDFWVVKTDSIGNILWQNTIGGDSDEGSNVTNQPLLELTSDGGYILGGFSESNISGDKTENSMGLFDYWIVKLTPDITSGVSGTATDIKTYSLFPNPATDKIQVQGSTSAIRSIEIYDALGKNVYSYVNQQHATDEIIIDASSLQQGIYFVKVNDGGNYSTKKLIIQN
jgi:hypothetical protein